MLEKGTTPPFVVRLVRKVKYYSFLTYVFAFAYMYFMVCQPLFGYTNVSENAWLPGVVIERFDKHASIPKFTNGLEKAYKERSVLGFNFYGLILYFQECSNLCNEFFGCTWIGSL